MHNYILVIIMDDTKLEVEKQEIKEEDVVKAKKKGSFFGDPIVVIE